MLSSLQVRNTNCYLCLPTRNETTEVKIANTGNEKLSQKRPHSSVGHWKGAEKGEKKNDYVNQRTKRQEQLTRMLPFEGMKIRTEKNY